MNKLLNDALRAKGYKGPDVKMVLTDVTDPNGSYYTDTLTNTVVFDRNELANANRDQILNALGHEFGHYSKEDDIDKSNHWTWYLISKTMISTKDSEQLYKLIKEEKTLENHLKNSTLTKEQKEKLKKEINKNLQMELVKKIKKSRELKIPKVDSDAWN